VQDAASDASSSALEAPQAVKVATSMLKLRRI